MNSFWKKEEKLSTYATLMKAAANWLYPSANTELMSSFLEVDSTELCGKERPPPTTWTDVMLTVGSHAVWAGVGVIVAYIGQSTREHAKTHSTSDTHKSNTKTTKKQQGDGSGNFSIENTDSVSDVSEDGDLGRDSDQDDDNDERVHQWMDDACSQRRQRQQRYGNLDKCSSISDDSCNCGNCNPQLEDGISGPPGCVKWLVDLHDPSSK